MGPRCVRVLLILGMSFFPAALPAASAEDAVFREHMRRDLTAYFSQCLNGLLGQYPAGRDATGTTWLPDAATFAALWAQHGRWLVTAGGFAHLGYARQENGRDQDGPVFSQLFSVSLRRPGERDMFGARAVFSLERLAGEQPSSVAEEPPGPLAGGRSPDPYAAELAFTYSRYVSEQGSLFAYAGLPGEPSVGLPRFTDRLTGARFPGVPLGRARIEAPRSRWGVLTGGYTWNGFKMEASVFGDDSGAGVRTPEFNARAARISAHPLRSLALQASAAEIPGGASDPGTTRLTASGMYHRELRSGSFQGTAAWSRDHLLPGPTLDAVLVEAALLFGRAHAAAVRCERVERFTPGDVFEEIFAVYKASVGYAYEVRVLPSLSTAIGTELGVAVVPEGSEETRDDAPVTWTVFVTARFGQ